MPSSPTKLTAVFQAPANYFKTKVNNDAYVKGAIVSDPTTPPAAGASVKLTAPAAATGYMFKNWTLSGGLTLSDGSTTGAIADYTNPITVKMPSNNNGVATANYATPKITMGTYENATLTVKAGTRDAVAVTPETLANTEIKVGETVDFTVTHTAEYELTGWTITRNDNGAAITLRVWPPYRISNFPATDITVTPIIERFADIEGVVQSVTTAHEINTASGTTIWASTNVGRVPRQFASSNYWSEQTKMLFIIIRL